MSFLQPPSLSLSYQEYILLNENLPGLLAQGCCQTLCGKHMPVRHRGEIRWEADNASGAAEKSEQLQEDTSGDERL